VAVDDTGRSPGDLGRSHILGPIPPHGVQGGELAETRLSKGKTPERKAPRLRAGRRLRERHNFVGFHGHGLLALIFFAIIALSVLGVGLGLASLTIFSVGRTANTRGLAVLGGPTPSPSATSGLVGRPIDGTIVGLWVDKNLIAIQPAGGQPIQATVNTKSTLTLGGATATLPDLIPGDAVIVTLSQGSDGTLVVLTLQDIQTVPTNTPSAPPTPIHTAPPAPSAEPVPTASPASG